jgi:hypothetical protein
VIERGVNIEEELSAIKEPSEIKGSKEPSTITKGKNQKETVPLNKSESNKPKQAEV